MSNNYPWDNVPSVTYETFNNGEITKATTCYDSDDVDTPFYKIIESCNPKFVDFDLNWDFLDDKGKGLTPSFATLTAYARRNPDDKFDEKIGRDAALKNVLKKYHKIRHRQWREIVHDLRMVLARVELYCAKKNINLDGVPTIEEFIAKS